MGISSHIRASVCGGVWWHQISWYIIFQRFSIEFSFGECEDESVVSMPSSTRNCLHTLATWCRALSCTGMHPAYNRLTHESVCDTLSICLPRPSLAHCKIGHAGWWQLSQWHVLTPWCLSYALSVKLLSMKRSANFGVFWWMLVSLHGAGLWFTIACFLTGQIIPGVVVTLQWSNIALIFWKLYLFHSLNSTE